MRAALARDDVAGADRVLRGAEWPRGFEGALAENRIRGAFNAPNRAAALRKARGLLLWHTAAGKRFDAALGTLMEVRAGVRFLLASRRRRRRLEREAAREDRLLPPCAAMPIGPSGTMTQAERDERIRSGWSEIRERRAQCERLYLVLSSLGVGLKW